MNIEKLRKLREDRGLFQKEVAEALGISQARYSHYELGNREPDNQTLRHIAVFFDISLDYLLDVTDTPTLPNQPPQDPLNRELSNLSEENRKKAESFIKFLKTEEIVPQDLPVHSHMNCIKPSLT